MAKISNDKDRLILFELIQDSRQPLSRIAKAVNLPQQTVSYRIKKMEESGVIKKYTINVNYSKLGYRRHSLYLDLKEINPDEVDKILDQIVAIQEVSCCYILREAADWKMYISIWTKNLEKYDEIQSRILNKFKNKINNYLFFSNLIQYNAFERILNPAKKTQTDIKGAPEDLSIKEIDWKLLELLKANSKTPIINLANKLKISGRAVIRRINLLRKKGIIQRFYPWINPKKLGYDEYTYIARIDPAYSKEVDQFIEFARENPRFKMFQKAVGYVNLSYSFLVKNDDELAEIKAKINEILGKGKLQSFRIEINDMRGR